MRPAVLVVEDDHATRTLLRLVLDRAGFDVDLVSSGTDVMTLLASVGYSALLFDLYMRGTSGHDLLAALTTTTPEMLARVIVVSSAPKQEMERVRELYPMVRVLRKPFELDDFIAAVTMTAAPAEPPTRDLAAEFCRRSIINGAKTGVVFTPTDGTRFDVAMSYGYTRAMLEEFLPVAIDGPYPACTAYRHRRAIWLASMSVASTEYPLLAPLWEANHSHALAALPLVADGNTIGAAGWSFRDARSFAVEERMEFEAIAGFLAKELAASSSRVKAG